MESKDYLYLIWKNLDTKDVYTVGILTKYSDHYEFKYDFEINEAIESGFRFMLPFIDKEKTYKSDKLFPAFSTRVPDSKRDDIQDILNTYEMDKYDTYELIKRCGAIGMDGFSLIDPLINNNEPRIKRFFRAAGVDIALRCKKNAEECKMIEKIVSESDSILFEIENDNIHNEPAIKLIEEKSNKHIGYIPKYYCKGIYKLLKNKYKYKCKIYSINKWDCDECILLEVIFEKSE